jgi:hypothetical protein
MKIAGFIVAAMIATPAVAASDTLQGGEWISNASKGATEERIQFKGLDFIRWVPERMAFVPCKVTNWPVSSPNADGVCDDGSKHTLEIGNGTLIFDGHTMTHTFEE